MLESEFDDILSVFSESDMLVSDNDLCSPPVSTDPMRPSSDDSHDEYDAVLFDLDEVDTAAPPISQLTPEGRATLLAEADDLPMKLPILASSSLLNSRRASGKVTTQPVSLAPIISLADSSSRSTKRPIRQVKRTALATANDYDGDSEIDSVYADVEQNLRTSRRTGVDGTSKNYQRSSASDSLARKKRRRTLEELNDPDFALEKRTLPGKRTKLSKAVEPPPVEDDPIVYRMLPIELRDGQNEDNRRLAIMQALRKLAITVTHCLTDANLSEDHTTAAFRPIAITMESRRSEDSASRSQGARCTVTRCLMFPRLCGDKDTPRLGGRELACLMRVADLVHEGLKRGVTSTLRDLYYRDVPLFGRQQIVDGLVDDIAASLHVRRGDLNIIAASKGLFTGALRLHTVHGDVLEGGTQGALVPAGHSIDKIEANSCKWVLVIEKEAVFQTLCSAKFCDRGDLPAGVILTGKGYPDVSTRELLKGLSDALPSAPLLCLVDADPHGLEILLTYRQGSSARAFDRNNLATEKLRWLGIKGTDWDELGVDRDELIPLTLHDRKKAASMLKRPDLPSECRRELEYMLHLGRKAEIQVLSSCHGSRGDSPLVRYLVRELNAACTECQGTGEGEV